MKHKPQHLIPALFALTSLTACAQTIPANVEVGPWSLQGESIQCDTVEDGAGKTLKECSGIQTRAIRGEYLDESTGEFLPFSSLETQSVTYRKLTYSCGGSIQRPHKIKKPPALEPAEYTPIEWEPKTFEPIKSGGLRF
jgi:hypothetical protein